MAELTIQLVLSLNEIKDLKRLLKNTGYLCKNSEKMNFNHYISAQSMNIKNLKNLLKELERVDY